MIATEKLSTGVYSSREACQIEFHHPPTAGNSNQLIEQLVIQLVPLVIQTRRTS